MIQQSLPAEEVQALIHLLRRKEENWVAWGQACQTLQAAGYAAQQIFEETGFEPIHQNQVVVAAKVYGSLLQENASEEVRSHFGRVGSDVLYELRVLSQTERVGAATLALEKKLDAPGARDLAKAIKDFNRLANPPEEFTAHSGDAIAYQCWRRAHENQDLQERSRLIARGLQFAASGTARAKLEQLLTDFTVTPSRRAPILPIYRQESDEELPRILPLINSEPLTRQTLEAIAPSQPQGSFQWVISPQASQWIALPGWGVLLSSTDPVALLSQSDQLPTRSERQPEEVLIVIERQFGGWDADHYFLVEQGGQLEWAWFATPPEVPLLGQLLLVLRPKKILDENALTGDDWSVGSFDE